MIGAERVTDDPAENLAELFSAVWERRRPHMLAERWFIVGVLRAAREGEQLDIALGLNGPGIRTIQRRLIMGRRDAHLRAALRAVALAGDVSDWRRCLRLTPLLVGFMRTWDRTKRLTDPSPDWPEWKREVFRAAQCDVPLPRTAGGLRGVLLRTPPFSLNDGKENMLARYL